MKHVELKLKKWIDMIFILSLIFIFFTGCTKEDKSEPIVLPPGSDVSYSNSEFLKISAEYYDVELTKYNNSEKRFESITNISPQNSLDKIQTINYTLPKDKNTGGLFTVKVNLSRQPISLEAFVIPERLTTPNIATTLVVNLLKKFPHREIDTYRTETIVTLEDFVNKYIEKQFLRFPELSNMDFIDVYKFYSNGLSSNYEFLKLLDDYQISFNYSDTGIITKDPYMFGKKNNFPQLDLANSTSINRDIQGQEKVEVLIRAKAIDLESDKILFSWKKDGVQIDPVEKTEFRWTPDYDQGRAAPYLVSLIITDGGQEQILNWNVNVENLNRKPQVASTCPKIIKENELITCQITFVDFDGEKMKISLKDSGVNARALLNSQKTDDVTRTVTINNLNTAQLTFTASNKDAFARSAYFQIEVEDESQGVTIFPLVMAIEDINEPPIMIAGPQEISSGTDHEWDFCADTDPDGGITPYDFYITVQDPDNLKSTLEGGFDAVANPILTGSLACIGNGCIESLVCPGTLVSTAQLQYFCYRWKVSHTKKTGNVFFTFKDDHGGTSEIVSSSLSASDRNQKPCLSAINNANSVTLSLDLPLFDYMVVANDNDLIRPNISLTSDGNSDIYPFLVDKSIELFPIFRKKLVGNTLSKPFYRTSNIDINSSGGSNFSFRTSFTSPYSGVVRFYRPSGHTNEVVIPKDFVIELNSNLRPYFKYKYKTAVAATMAADDIEIWVPVVIFDQQVAAGQLNSIKPVTISGTPISSVGLTFSNSAALSDTGTVTITRASTAGALVLPKFIEFYSSNEVLPTVSSVRYYNYLPVKFADGQSSANVTVNLLRNRINQTITGTTNYIMNSAFTPFLEHMVTSAIGSEQNILNFGSALSDPNLKANYENLYNYINYSLYPINGFSTRGLTVSAEDNFTLPVGSIVTDQNGDSYRISSNITLFGFSQIDRLGSITNPLTSPFTLNAVTTVLRSSNGSSFKITQDLFFPANTTVVSAFIERINHTNPLIIGADGKISVRFSDKNFKPVFISPVGALSLTLNENQKTNDFLLQVNDNPSNPGIPNDPFDRHSFLFELQSAAPNGQISFCREPGDSLTVITSPVCTPCGLPIAGEYFDSATCYIRFFPKITQNDSTSDIDQTFSYLVTANDNSSLTFGEPNQTKQILTIKVNEVNDPPLLADQNWNSLPATTELTAYTCGAISCGDFLEGNNLQFSVYAVDPDRNSGNKSLSFSLGNQIYDLQTNSWIPRPTSLSITTNSPHSLDVYGGGWGSRYSGRISWTPTDAEAKSLAGAGFVIRVQVSDNPSAPEPKLTNFRLYKVSVQNINNPPNLKNVLNLTFVSDQYIQNSSSIVIQDKDYISIGAPVNFATSLSLCKSDSIFNCQAPLDGWPDALKNYDPNYVRNSGVAQCRSGASLNSSLATPFLTRGAPIINNTTKMIEFPYRIEWCAQRSHIGTHNVYLQINDNGDKDRMNQSRISETVTAPMTINVVAPIFFTSPLKDVNNIVINAPNQAFVGRLFSYQTLITNSRKNSVRFQLLNAPSGMLLDNNSLTKNDTNTAIGVILRWTPTIEQLSTENIATWHLVNLKVTDTMTGESDSVSYIIQVKNASNPVQIAPTISSKTPNVVNPLVDENMVSLFSVVANDLNPSDRLYYNWFVDNVKKFDEGPAFNYFPSINDFGLHTVRVEVTDGFYVTSYTWNVKVRNTVPNIVTPVTPIFDLAVFNQTKLAKPISLMKWGTETKVETFINPNTFNSIIFTGSYTKSSLHRDFVYNLRFKNGLVFPNIAANINPLIAESLPWEPGRDSERISFKTTVNSTNFTIITTPYNERETSFSSGLTKATCLPNALQLSTFNASHLCNGTNAAELYNNENAYGGLLSAVFSELGSYYDINADKTFANLKWTNLSNSNIFYDVTTLGGGVRISGISVSNKTKKIYVTARDIATSINKLLIFDATPLLNLQNPTLITILNINDGINPDNKASDVLVVNEIVNSNPIDKVYVMLPGTGGVAMLEDNMTIPVDTDLQFIANTGAMGKSPVSISNAGKKIVYNSGSKLVYGIAKGANQVFSLDITNNVVRIQPIAINGGLDAILSFDNDSSLYGVSRTLGQIFHLK